MSCYIRHLEEYFEILGLENNNENRKRLDLVIREVLEIPAGEHCPEVWKRVKEIIYDKEKSIDLIEELKNII